MSLYYVESNTESALELHQKRTIYRGNVLSATPTTPNFVDFNQGEKYFYGRVDRRFVPITYASGVPLKMLDSVISKTAALKVAGFAAEAFRDLVRQFNKCVLTGQISPDDPFLSNLKAYKAYIDPGNLYYKHIQSHFTAIAATFLNKNITVKNFDDFVKELMILLQKSAHTVPFTQTAYMKSKYCSMLANALTIEIADLDPANDEEKINQFIESPNWNFYLNACKNYGFMVDRAIPWRIVVDIASPLTLEYAAKYGVRSTNSILSRMYATTHKMYYPKFKFWLLQLYNKVRLPSFLITEECNGSTISKIYKPETYSNDSLVSQYPESYFLELYCKIRFLEEESKFKDYERDILIDDTIELYRSKNINQALRKFETIINKPFDYRGSVGYNIKYLRARRDAEEP